MGLTGRASRSRVMWRGGSKGPASRSMGRPCGTGTVSVIGLPFVVVVVATVADGPDTGLTRL